MPLDKRSVVPHHSGAASAVLGVLLALFPAAGTCGQASQCAGIPSPPSDAALRLLLKNGRSVFHQGEILALTTEYAADSNKKYVVNNRNYDRSVRLSGEEIFCLEPERGTDPLDDYFHSILGYMGGRPKLRAGSGSPSPHHGSGTERVEVTATRIVSPDHRRHRLSLGKEGEATTWNGTSMPLRSNTVEFEVQPADPDRQASQLASVTGVLDSPGASKEDKKHAARVLRFLGSEASTRELARRYASGNGRSNGTSSSASIARRIAKWPFRR
jgi:hypothetical protein